jgi:hypothetical protein
MLSADMKKQLLGYQRSEITEHHIYRRLARIQKSPENRKILERIAEDEKRHYNLWKIYGSALQETFCRDGYPQSRRRRLELSARSGAEGRPGRGGVTAWGNPFFSTVAYRL